MHLWFFYQSQLSSFLGNDHPADNTRNNPSKRLAIKRLKAQIAQLHRHARVEICTERGDSKKVWIIQFTSDDALYADRRSLYALNEHGHICPREWSTMDTDEINFIIHYL